MKNPIKSKGRYRFNRGISVVKKLSLSAQFGHKTDGVVLYRIKRGGTVVPVKGEGKLVPHASGLEKLDSARESEEGVAKNPTATSRNFTLVRRPFRGKRRIEILKLSPPAGTTQPATSEAALPARPVVPLEMAGKWIAWSPDKTVILACGDTLDEARSKAGGGKDLILSHVPRPRRFIQAPKESGT